MARLTEEEINILRYSWGEWEDFNRSLSFKEDWLKEKDPILWRAWKDYEYAKEILDRLVANLDEQA